MIDGDVRRRRRDRSSRRCRCSRYDEAMLRYGSDKPDLRFGFEIVDLSDVFAASGFQVFRGAVDAGGVRARDPRARRRRRSRAPRSTPSPRWPRRTAPRAWPTCTSRRGARLRGPIVKFLAEAEQRGARRAHRRRARRPDRLRRRPGRRRRRRARRPARRAHRAARARPRARAGRRSGSSSSRSSRSTPRPARSPTATTRSACRPPRRSRCSRPTRCGLRRAVRPRAQRRRARLGLAAQPRRPTCSAPSCTPWASTTSASQSAFGFVPRGARVRRARRTAASASASTVSSCCSPGRTSIRDVIAFPKTASGSRPDDRRPGERRRRRSCKELRLRLGVTEPSAQRRPERALPPRLTTRRAQALRRVAESFVERNGVC